MLIDRAAGLLPVTVAQRYPHGYAVVDVETSGLRPASDRVLQVAIAQVAADGNLEATWSTLLDPECDPGPTHIHGLTRSSLAGSPKYAQVAAHVAGMVAGRVLVAHNAQFDWRFLSAEAARGHAPLAVEHRLCTLALTRRLDLPLPNMQLGSVAAYWGVPQLRAHDAVDDTRVLVEILRHSLVVADRLGLTLPLSTCTAGSSRQVFPARAPRPHCPWRHTDRWVRSGPLVQGMRVVFTGLTRTPRETLMRRATAAGLDVMNSASSRTSVLVCNDLGCDTRKLASARHHQVPVITEAHFLSLLSAVGPGTPKGDLAPISPRGASGRPPVLAPLRIPRQRGFLAQRRILTLGGPHHVASAVRERISHAGGQAAANLTATVSDVIALSGAEFDPRWARVIAANLTFLDPDTLKAVGTRTDLAQTTRHPSAGADQLVVSQLGLPAISTRANGSPGNVNGDSVHGGVGAVVLPRGGVTDLPAASEWSLSVRWPDLGPVGVEVDVVALLTDVEEEVGVDDDFVFFNAPRHPCGAVDLTLDIPGEALVNMRPARLPARTTQVMIAAAIPDGATFDQVGPVELVLRDHDGAIAARATLDAATREQTLVLATLYRRGSSWRFRAVGQGYELGLAAVAARHGVDIDED